MAIKNLILGPRRLQNCVCLSGFDRAVPVVDSPHDGIDSKLLSLECFDPRSSSIDLPFDSSIKLLFITMVNLLGLSEIMRLIRGRAIETSF